MPVIGLIGAGIGLYQTISGGIKAKKEQNKLEGQVNGFQPNQSIMDYYNKALAKYNPNPYETIPYKQQQKQINQNLATGMNAIQNRRLGVGAIGGLVQQANDASGKAAANADNANNQQLNILGSAAQAKTNEEQKKFDMLYNLTAMKAGAAASRENSGISNINSGLSTAAYLYGNQEKGKHSLWHS